MKGTLFLILGTPESKRRTTLVQAVDSNDNTSHFLLPAQLGLNSLDGSHWKWEKKHFFWEKVANDNINEWFLFLSNEIDLAEQIEALIDLTQQNEDLKIGRILTFINSELLKTNSNDLRNWIDACAHFTDVMLFSNRKNDNAGLISNLIERFKNKCYPMETHIIGNNKKSPLNQILSPVPLRVSHIFDPKELLEPEDSAKNDPYLAFQPNGKRIIPIPLPFN